MSRTTPHMRNFAQRLIADEARGHPPAVPLPPTDFKACEKLRPTLATLMGNAGARALLLRALALAQGEVPWLRAVQVKADGTLARGEQRDGQLALEDLVEGRVVMLAQLLGLLVAFIGENLTLHLVRDVWPKVRLDDVEFGTEGTNEKRN
jgi:hypothetical protein